MQFPDIIKELEKKKKAKNLKGTPLVSIIYDSHVDNMGVTQGEYTIYINPKFDRDPFIKTMLSRIQNYIDKAYM